MTTLSTGKATEFIQFTRASNATVTDSDGKVKWAPHNLLTNSESFQASAWNLLSATVASNTYASPAGVTTADTITLSAGGVIYQNSTVQAAAHTLGVWVRSTTGTAVFRLTYYNGTTSVNSADFTASTTWQLFSFAITGSGVAGNVGITVGAANAAATVVAWGAHLYRSDLGGMQPNTSAYPMYNPTTPKNLAAFTEDFSNAYWVPVGILAFGSGSVSNAIIAPNGLQVADLIVGTTGVAAHALRTTTRTATATSYTASVYAKAGGYNFLGVQYVTDGYSKLYEGVFNISTGVVETTGRGVSYTGSCSITPVGNGWYRCSVTVNLSDATSSSYVVFVVQQNNNPTTPFAGDGTSGIYLWGAQLSDSASLDSYSPVYGAAVTSAAYYGPRRDFDGATLACKGLLVEEQRANLLLNSAAFDAASWAAGDGGAATVTANTAVSPSGLQTADTIDDTSGSVTQGRRNPVAITSGSGAYTCSIFIKKNTSNCASIRVTMTGGTAVTGELVVDTTNGVAQWRTGVSGTSFAITSVGNGWYRCSVTITDNASGHNTIGLEIRPAFASTYLPTIEVAATGSVYVYGAQLEAGSFATSYIPTGAATATRNADVASVSTQAFPYGSTEGTLVFSGTTFKPTTVSGIGTAVELSDGTAFNRVNVRFSSATAGAVINVTPSSTVAYTADALEKLAVAYKVSDNVFVRNGTVVSSITSALPVGVDRMTLGTLLNGHIRQITYLPRRLSNTELQTRTA